MNKTIFGLFVSFSAQAAVELKFIGPCHEEFIMRNYVTEDFATIGDLTVETLKKFNVPYTGSAEGLNSVFNTPVGAAAIEQVSALEFRSYGWCFAVNGVAPEIYPHQYPVTPEVKSVTWTYGFARNLNGKWVTQCTPAYTVKPASLCKDPTAEK